MSSCRDIEPLVTAYLDGEAAPADRAKVDAHLKACPPCRQHATAESAARDVLRARRAQALGASASAELRSRCADVCRSAADPAAGSRFAARLRSRAVPLSMAAALVLAVGGIFLYGLTSESPTAMAAQLTLDHVTCFKFATDAPGRPAGPEHVDARAIEARLESRYGWHLKVPPTFEPERFRLIAARRCFYAEGGVAHVMYRHEGRPVSLYIVPGIVRPSRFLDVMGHEALIWSRGDKTYVMVAREPRVRLERLAAYVRSRSE